MSDYIIGLTGGVASGKGVVADGFLALGVAVIDADAAARDAVGTGSPALAAIVDAFGPRVLDADGALDRAAMRRRVFADDADRRRLEAIVHPHVRDALRRASAVAPGVYCVVVVPLLAEGGGRDGYPWLDRILVVDVHVDVQRERLMRRDAIDGALAARMLAAQAGRRERLAIADDVLVNDGLPQALRPHVAALDRQYRSLAGLKFAGALH